MTSNPTKLLLRKARMTLSIEKSNTDVGDQEMVFFPDENHEVLPNETNNVYLAFKR